MPDNQLIEDILNYLDISWADNNTQNKIINIIDNGIADLDERTVSARLDGGRDEVNGEICRGDLRHVPADDPRASARGVGRFVHEKVITHSRYDREHEHDRDGGKQFGVFFRRPFGGARRLFGRPLCHASPQYVHFSKNRRRLRRQAVRIPSPLRRRY